MKRIKYYIIVIFVGSFLSNCNTINKQIVEEETSRLIPSFGITQGQVSDSIHPLAEKINHFLLETNLPQDFKTTGLDNSGYLKVIDGQVRAMQKYQDGDGRIIDPVENEEKFYTTPCYAHSVAALVASSYIQKDDPLAISGMKALNISLSDMVKATVNGDHGDFYTWPVMFAYELYKPHIDEEQLKEWNQKLQSIKTEELYRTYNKAEGNNWVLVHTAGEFLRAKNEFTNLDYVEQMLRYQLPNFTELGMYNENGNPLAYDLFSRHYMCGMLYRNYDGQFYDTLKDALWKGAWMSLFMQSPFGELATGFRSSHHIWNEAEQCVIFEIYATEYAKLGYEKEAGVFKRAAMLSLGAMNEWIREDGSGFVVKNRYPIEAKHAYETYSVHTCYNMLACSMLAQAWQFSDNSIAEKPAPADVGGFVVPVLNPFHKIFANANGTYLEYDTNGDQKYNPTGILRMHIKGGHPQLGPSDGAAQYYSGEGLSLATGLSWQNADGSWTSLAEQKVDPQKVGVIEETPNSVKFQIVYNLEGFSEGIIISEVIGIKDGIITVENEIQGATGKKRINWPMLVFDGKNEVEVKMDNSTVSLELYGKGVCFSVLQEAGITLDRTGERINHRNGLVETVFGEFEGTKIKYQLSAK